MGGPAQVTLAAILGQVYVFTDQDGWTYHFDVAAGYTLAKKRAPQSLITFSRKECGIDMDALLSRYPDLNRQYAASLPMKSLAEPVLFLPWKGKHLLIDGYHRLAKAVLSDVDVLPSYLLTPEEAESIVIARLPPASQQRQQPEEIEVKLESIFARKFEPGNILATPGAIMAFHAAGENPLRYLLLHLACHWGEVDRDDWGRNDWAVRNNARLLSAYSLRNGTKIWLITEADRSATTIMTSSEY